MSELRVDKISPRSGTELTLGDASDDFLLPSGAEIKAKSGSTITIESGATLANAGTATGFGGGGKIVQVVNVQDATTGSGTTTVPSDDTIPQVGETNLFLTLNITPTSASNKLYIVANVNVVFGGADNYTLIALFNDDTHATNALAVNYLSHHVNFREQLFLQHYMLANQNTEMTFKIGAATGAAGTVYKNSHTTGARVYGGKMFSEMTIMEIAA